MPLLAQSTAAGRLCEVLRFAAGGLAIVFIVILNSPAFGALTELASIRGETTDGLWEYATSNGPREPFPGPNSSYVPVRGDYLGHVFSTGFLAPQTGTSSVTGGDAWFGTADFDQSSFHIFSTYVRSDFDQVISLAVAGDDGHSLYVDGGVFLGGGPVGSMVSSPITLQAGVPRRIDVAGYNATGPWSFAVGEPIVPTPNEHPQFMRRLQEIPGVRLNARGHFPAVAGASQVGNLGLLNGSQFLVSDPSTALASPFVTDESSYRLDSISMVAQAAAGTTAEARIRADDGGAPGQLLASLGFRQFAGGGVNETLTFDSSGLGLAPNTRYWVTVGEQGRGSFAPKTAGTVAFSPGAWGIEPLVLRNQGGWSDVAGNIASLALRVDAQQVQPIDLGTITVHSIGHRVITAGNSAYVIDTLVTPANDYPSYGGGALLAPINVDMDASSQAKFRVAAPEGSFFLVDPVGDDPMRMELTLIWGSSSQNPMFRAATVEYEGLVGTAPTLPAAMGTP